MNNAQYFSILDIARLDFIIRSGLPTQLLKHGYYSIVEAQTIRFKKSLLPFDKFKVVTKIVGWDDKAFYLTQKFVRGHTVVSEAVVKTRFLKKDRTVPPRDLLKSVNQFQVSPKIDDSILTWNRTMNLSGGIKTNRV
ncbi:MAG: thioesterase family protein [Spirochaetota bacterium]